MQLLVHRAGLELLVYATLKAVRLGPSAAVYATLKGFTPHAAVRASRGPRSAPYATGV
jgi:hypothetical protein